MRGLTGKLNWAAREGMPQAAGDASLLSANMLSPRVKDLQEANAALRRLLQQGEVNIVIRPIPLERLRLVVFVDASLGNASGGSSQLAHMVCAVEKSIHEGKDATISPLCYHSHKSTRSGSSTLLVESNSMSEALADCEWVAS